MPKRKESDYPYRSKEVIEHHGRKGHPLIHIDENGKTYIMVRKKGGGTRRKYDFR